MATPSPTDSAPPGGQEPPTPPAVSMTWEKLGEVVGADRKTLFGWRKLAGAPAEPDPELWQAFMKEHGLGEFGTRLAPVKARTTKLELESELLRQKIARESRRVIPREEVNRLLAAIAVRARNKLYQFLETEAPPKLDGLPAVQQRPILREMADAICDEMADLVRQFEQGE